MVQHGVQVRVVGDLSLAPPPVRLAAERIMAATRHHTRAVLNICFSYTASEEMLRALGSGSCLEGPTSSSGGGGGSSPGSLSEAAWSSSSGGGSSSHDGGSGPLAALDSRLYTSGCPPVGLLIRTSGETRLSDFLLWQTRHALLVFTSVLWPDFSFLDLSSAILEFQRAARTLGRLQAAAAAQAPAAAALAAAAAQPRMQQQREAVQEGSLSRQADAAGALPVLRAVKAHLLGAEQCGPAGDPGQDQGESPRSVASPDEPPSSPSSRSDGSGEHLARLSASPESPCPEEGVQQLRQRRPAAIPPHDGDPPPMGSTLPSPCFGTELPLH